MKKNDIIKAISKKTNFTIENTETAFNALIEVLSEAMESGEEKIVLKDIGTFNRKIKAARICRDPRNGTPVNVPEKIVYSFKISGNLQNKLNG